VDCAADNRVKSEIRDNYDSLVESGYSAIIGVRDVYPDFSRAEIPKLRTALDYKIKTKPIRVVFALGVMEIETWFVCEHTHFSRLSPQLTCACIRAHLGFDPETEDIQMRPNPAADLDSAYCLAGLRYTKSRRSVQRTLQLLDYASMYLTVANRLPDLKSLVQSIEKFLES
jgi:hypothetical protein